MYGRSACIEAGASFRISLPEAQPRHLVAQVLNLSLCLACVAAPHDCTVDHHTFRPRNRAQNQSCSPPPPPRFSLIPESGGTMVCVEGPGDLDSRAGHAVPGSDQTRRAGPHPGGSGSVSGNPILSIVFVLAAGTILLRTSSLPVETPVQQKLCGAAAITQ